ncbi:MAG: hypothetical protein UU71_C0021G0002 [Parcubacteria group bacterium GW2011_GWB1_41_6]|nr:MAG: hypothetical protein UU71_C0021G0002 [Parcubacteria group bacterium GW2011_GWB1_41_6]KKS33386.1 MAG: hypothetical protein UU96_C0026G0013 [Parcubacteria group bacterium GW2011_GWC2_42_13]KKS70586.1 MAG: hypothetical protein UV43_C0058G0005 [Parcubacteria group bacterium GW2011_GWF2_42_7]
MRQTRKIIFLLFGLAPVLVLAEATVGSLLSKVQTIIGALVPLLGTAAFVVFLWGVVKFISAGGNEEKRKESKNLIIYGLIGLFVMVAVWGIIKLVAGTFDLQEGGDINAPQFKI